MKTPWRCSWDPEVNSVGSLGSPRSLWKFLMNTSSINGGRSKFVSKAICPKTWFQWTESIWGRTWFCFFAIRGCTSLSPSPYTTRKTTSTSCSHVPVPPQGFQLQLEGSRFQVWRCQRCGWRGYWAWKIRSHTQRTLTNLDPAIDGILWGQNDCISSYIISIYQYIILMAKQWTTLNNICFF